MSFTPTPEQTTAVDLACEGGHLAIEALAGTGKALRVDQPVLTPEGFVPIGSLRVGDSVIGGDGLPCEVLGVYPQGVRSLFTIGFSDGTEVVADADHRWLVQRVDERCAGLPGKVRTTAEIGRKLTTPTKSRGGGTTRAYWFMPMCEPVKFPATVTPLDPWLMGVLTGDGSLTGTVTLSTADPEILDAVRGLVEPLGVQVTRNPSSTYDYRLGGRQTRPGHRGFWNPIVNALKAVGLRGKGSHERFVPDCYRMGDIDTRVAFLQGLFDTDGCRSAQAVEFTTTSARLAADVKFIVESLGGTAVASTKATSYHYLGHKRDGRIAHRLYIKIPTWMAPFRLSRKMEGWTGGQRPPFRSVVSVTPCGDAEAVCIEVSSSDHLFLTAGCVPTHNTSTLQLIAEAQPKRRGMFIAFNKAIVLEAQERFPRTVTCSTAHSLAFRAVGKHYAHRLKAPRMRSLEIARVLGIDDLTVTTSEGSRRLAAGWLAGYVIRGIENFCRTADTEPNRYHIPRPRPKRARGEEVDAGGPLAEVWDDVRGYLEIPLRRAWQDLARTEGRLQFTHNNYLKLYQLTDPRIETDFLLLDESQDLNPLMLAIAEGQRDHAQLVLVGDANQRIYGWNGAVDAMSVAQVDHRTRLSESFRFGPEIAEEANRVLEHLGDVRIIGRAAAGTVGPIDRPDIILSRTNASAVGAAFAELDAGGRPHIVGGADDVVSFARAAQALMAGRRTEHPEIGCFESWQEVRDYVRQDELGSDLQLLVKLVDDFGADRIVSAFDRQPREDQATLVLSTAHKSKGREWGAVQLAGDFSPEPEGEELRLLYVAATRAERALDTESVAFLHLEADDPDEADEEPAEAPSATQTGRKVETGLVHVHELRP